MDKSHVIARIENWEQRIEALYALIEEWFQQLPPDPLRQLLPGSVLQRDESLMRQFNVPPPHVSHAVGSL